MRPILRVPFLNLGAISDFEAIDTKFWINIGLSTFLTNKFYCFYQQFDTLNKLKLLNSQPEYIQRLGLGVGDELAVKCAIAKLQEPQSVVGCPEACDQDVSQRELSESPAGENYEGWYFIFQLYPEGT